MNKKIPISVVMLTLNEEYHLPGVLDNIFGWAQDIFVLDSLSTDRTVDIALEYGVHIVQHPFTNFGDQWNWALKNLPISTPWTLKLDPDERLSGELKEGIERAINSDDSADGYSFQRRLWFMGKPLHVKQDVLRLWRTGRCSFSNVIVNEHPIIDGRVEQLTGFLEHLDSSNLHHWWDKQNRYTTMRAIEIVKGQTLSAEPRLFGTSSERRMFFIKHFFRIPFRYQLQWFHEMFVRGAWLDGMTGIEWARQRINVRKLCDLKIRQMHMTGKIPDVPKAPHGENDPRIREFARGDLCRNIK